MRYFRQTHIGNACFQNDAIINDLRCFKQFAGAIASTLELPCSLRPEVSILLELFEAEKTGTRLTVSMLGLLDGIAPTTTLRYIEMLENSGALMRTPHENDNRMRYVQLMPEAKKAIEQAIVSLVSASSTSFKQTT